MLQLIVVIWLLSVIVVSFKDIKWGIALYLTYMLLIPVVRIHVGPILLGENVISLCFFIAYFNYVHRNGYKSDYRPLMPFIMFYIITLLLIPLQNGLPFFEMLNRWRVESMRNLIFPFVLWNVMINEYGSIYFLRRAIILVIGIAVFYGLYLTTTGGFNPYIMIMSGLMDNSHDMTSYYVAASSGRLYGRISSVFVHPMNYALFLGLSFIFIFQNRKNISKVIFAILATAIGISAITCGVRSVLGGLIIAIAYYFFIAKNYKVMIAIFFIAMLGQVIIENIPALSVYIGSMTDFTNSQGDVSGSSLEMRMEQLEGALNIVKDNPLLGNGYGWVGYYLDKNGNHPVCLAFESLLMVIICNWGFVGFIIYGAMIFMYMRNNRKMGVEEPVLLDCLMIFYIAYACITGDYGYMRFAILFYILMLGYEFNLQKYK